MAKKADEAEIKKECPSCGLGVALDSKACEFCGWDFDEEDEWILQIEKLERDLIMEKQRFEPGSVEDKIESTLKSPFYQRTEETEKPAKPRPAKPEAAPVAKAPVKAAVPQPAPVVREAKASGVKVVKPVVTTEEPKPVVRMIAPAPASKPVPKPAPAPVAVPAPVKAQPHAQTPQPPRPETAAQKTKKTRVVRKVKQAQS